MVKIQSPIESSQLNADSNADGVNVPSIGRLVGAAHAVSSNVTAALFAAQLLVYVHASRIDITVPVGDSSVIDTSLEYALVVPKAVGSSPSIGWKSTSILRSVIAPHAHTVIVLGNELLSAKLSSVAHHI
jgi:hypothetical protein